MEIPQKALMSQRDQWEESASRELYHINLCLLPAYQLDWWLSNLFSLIFIRCILYIMIQYTYMFLYMIKTSVIKHLVELYKIHSLFQFYPTSLKVHLWWTQSGLMNYWRPRLTVWKTWPLDSKLLGGGYFLSLCHCTSYRPWCREGVEQAILVAGFEAKCMCFGGRYLGWSPSFATDNCMTKGKWLHCHEPHSPHLQ